jgi:outer membrane protein OmpA-like peptidoglycan-associated protein
MRHAVGVGVLLPAVFLVATGCATKDFVREYVGQKETAIGQRITTVEGNVAEGNQRLTTQTRRLDQESQRIGTVEGRVTEQAQRVEGMGFKVVSLEKGLAETGEIAKGAQRRADEAYTKAEDVDGRLTRLWNTRNNRNVVDTVNVQFGFNRADLNDGAQTALLNLVNDLKQNPKLSVQLEGFTDQSGDREYNTQLSQRRMESVRRFLVEKGVELPRIHGIGLGPITAKGEPAAQQRRVTVKVTVDAE